MKIMKKTIQYSLLSLVTLIINVIVATVPNVQPPAREGRDCICPMNQDVCSCTFIIQYKLTMILETENDTILVYPSDGNLRMRGMAYNSSVLNQEQLDKVIRGDGETSRLVLTVNGTFPGPRIETWEKQILNLTLINALHTNNIAVHFHGQIQWNTPWMDGVAFVTQCPIQPGQTFVHNFTAYPVGTFFYHAHIGDQRMMGLYGPLIVRPKTRPDPEENEIIIALQDWNHLMGPETAFARMMTNMFDFQTYEVIHNTYSVDMSFFTAFDFQSGLANGKGRFWKNNTLNNGSPLERFKIRSGTRYRFRVIGAMTAYPLRVFIYGQTLILRSSDGYSVNNITVQSIIVHPGERFDFYWDAPAADVLSSKEFLLVAQSLETPESLGYSKYHAAEVVLEMEDFNGPTNLNPQNSQEEGCTNASKCVTFNCPYKYYPIDEFRECLNFNDVNNTDPNSNYPHVIGNKVDEEYFLNFGFVNGPSINGRAFIFPTVSLLTQPDEGIVQCPETSETCDTDGRCKCTHILKIPSNKLIQFVFTNLGSENGASHPVHVHGYSFYVMKMGFGTYDNKTGILLNNSQDITCTDRQGYCSRENWTDRSWSNGNIPNPNPKPPLKDTIVVPNGGYVVARIRSDNPGMWFLHCHIDFHMSTGMAMVIDVGDYKPTPPDDFPKCHSFLNKRTTSKPTRNKGQMKSEPSRVGLVVVGISVTTFIVGYLRTE